MRGLLRLEAAMQREWPTDFPEMWRKTPRGDVRPAVLHSDAAPGDGFAVHQGRVFRLIKGSHVARPGLPYPHGYATEPYHGPPPAIDKLLANHRKYNLGEADV